ncbi:hypothetical protein PYCCODRAFT_480488 [Trametes coccinea BRFM310]|uniref:Uncharacterized protein n=1 Tax=Trametes coccinea (strain BRFM310) TaxID=1353009 RepID=A0A1Y2IPD1_TRAC3|nr:hypothetical protein PYCCODRAFT_480488 [Trametes coccinea BRFM310]
MRTKSSILRTKAALARSLQFVPARVEQNLPWKAAHRVLPGRPPSVITHQDAADGGGTLTSQKANSTATKTARVAVTGPLAGGEQDVLEFLVAADRSFASLLERFRLAGLTSRARLEALAKWAREERDMFLVRELRLSAFEQKLVNDALARFPKSMA